MSRRPTLCEVTSMRRKRLPHQASPNPYVMAVLTAFLAGIVALAGSYFTARAQMKRFFVEHQLNMRRSAYTAFLERVDRVHSPVLSVILNIGSMDRNIGTDSEIQELEDTLHQLLRERKIADLYWQLNSDLKVIRLNGSQQVRELSEDLLKVLAQKYHEIDILRDPRPVQEYYALVIEHHKKSGAYGWEERLTEEERISVLLAARLFD